MKSPYTVHIDPDKARELAESGAILLLLDVPHGTVIGIDQQVEDPILNSEATMRSSTLQYSAAEICHPACRLMWWALTSRASK